MTAEFMHKSKISVSCNAVTGFCVIPMVFTARINQSVPLTVFAPLCIDLRRADQLGGVTVKSAPDFICVCFPDHLSTSKKKNVPEKAFKGIIKLVTSGDRLPDGVATIDREIRADSVATKETE